MSVGFWLSDRAWAAIEPLLPTNQPGARRVDDRRVISGIIHVLRIGCRWEDCPPDDGPSTTIYKRAPNFKLCLGALFPAFGYKKQLLLFLGHPDASRNSAEKLTCGRRFSGGKPTKKITAGRRPCMISARGIWRNDRFGRDAHQAGQAE